MQMLRVGSMGLRHCTAFVQAAMEEPPLKNPHEPHMYVMICLQGHSVRPGEGSLEGADSEIPRPIPPTFPGCS